MRRKKARVIERIGSRARARISYSTSRSSRSGKSIDCRKRRTGHWKATVRRERVRHWNKPGQVESNLAQIFDLAARWEAVLLFHEADVFLKSRGYDKGDLNRNTLVTAFLRILDYYDVILILTTNRIRSFNVAVQPRVHLAIRYNELSVDQLRELFLKSIKQHPDEVSDMKGIERWINEEFDDHIDGCQIRNVVSSARAMAKSKDSLDGKLRLQDIRAVLKMTSQFQQHPRDQRTADKRDQVVGDGKV